MTLTQYGLERSMVLAMRDEMGDGFEVALLYDGYEMPAERPLITIESMQSNFEQISKLREGIQSTYRFQIGIHDVNSVELSKNIEKLAHVFNFHRLKYIEESPADVLGFFYCRLTAVVRMPASDISKKTDYNRAYFDVEIENVKRSC